MKFTSWMLVLLFLAGCSGGMSRQVRDEAMPLPEFVALRAQPEEYRDETVILGGEIIETRNVPGVTTVLVLEQALGLDRKPKHFAASGGRFMVRFGEFLDPALFAAGRQVTTAGRVAGTETEMVGEAPYDYVLLEGREIHLWAERPDYPYSYGYDYFGHPYPYLFYYPYPHYRRYYHRD